MLKRIVSALATLAVCFGLAVPVHAQQPVQWRYSFNSAGVATATYPGEVVVNNGLDVISRDYNTASDFFNLTDDLARSVNYFQSTDLNTVPNKIYFNGMFDNVVSSNRANGPANASVGLGIRSIKPDWNTSTTTQEVDGLYIQTKTGKAGDTSGILVDSWGVTGGTSFVNMIEGSAGLFNTDGSINKRIRYQGPQFNQIDGTSTGEQFVVEKGIISQAILITSPTTTDYFTNNVEAFYNGVNRWTVSRDGNETLAGTLTASAVVARSIPPTTNTGSCTTVGGALGGGVAGAFTLTAACSAGQNIRLVFQTTAPTGWICNFQDLITNVTWRQVSYTTTSCTLVVSGATGAADQILYSANAF